MTEIRNLTDLAAYAQEQIERITRMQQDMAAAAGRGVSPERLVQATTGPGGRLVDLRVEPDLLTRPPHEVTSEIVAAITAAQTDFAARTESIMEPVLGARPSDRTDEIDDGIHRLDALTENLERLMDRPELR